MQRLETARSRSPENTGEITGSPGATGDKDTGGAMRPQEHGGALKTGNPGNVGGPGRPTKEETEFWTRMADSPEGQRVLEGMMLNPKHPMCAKLHMYAHDRVKGKPRQMVQVQTMPAPVVGPLDGLEHYYLDDVPPGAGVSRQTAGATDERR